MDSLRKGKSKHDKPIPWQMLQPSEALHFLAPTATPDSLTLDGIEE
jgi:hypothetical protein